MIYLQSTQQCCEKSLMHSYSIFIGLQKNNKYCMCVRLLLPFKTPVLIHVVNSSIEINTACGSNIVFWWEEFWICPVFLPLHLFRNSVALVYIAAQLESCSVCTQHTTLHFNRTLNLISTETWPLCIRIWSSKNSLHSYAIDQIY